MAKKIEKFEDLIAWQKARKLTAEIYRVTAIAPFASDFGLKDQIRRAAVSSMSNLAEGFERGRATEFHSFCPSQRVLVLNCELSCTSPWMLDI
ncbi:MAG TPA: four helix bundle protein [Pyrinomonadaceae bacterium]|nr:four helix bundle protein [Pyrinomonadaceae bacterium]